MIPNIVKGRGVSGALAYAMGQGNDKQTGKPKPLEEGFRSRDFVLRGGCAGGGDFGTERRRFEAGHASGSLDDRRPELRFGSGLAGS